MASQTEDPIDWSHPPHSRAVPPELHVLHGVNAAYKSQDLLHQPGLEHASTGIPDQRTTCAATQGMKSNQVIGSKSCFIAENWNSQLSTSKSSLRKQGDNLWIEKELCFLKKIIYELKSK